ncbi:lysozyme inhibitor LprI family protein [uncultured Clostridium sp.]|uniref:lysozyme inhibitor LprI family protein n=1 Tax=uncultured Clostridium sp. TaxID=59620 RepID=UPI0025FE1257|nr:lysozyme inhibitor LprI family protein [uncultured Clostridium sp.]
MKKIICLLLILTNTFFLSSCARIKIEDDDSNSQSTSSQEENNDKGETTDGSKDSDNKNTASDKSSTPDINININNGDSGNPGNLPKPSYSTRQYYLNKLDGIQAGLSDLDYLHLGSNADMKAVAAEEYRRWDDVLNEIYSELKGQLSYTEMNSLEKEELQWIKYKENEADRCASAFRGGTAEGLAYTSKLAELTKERCYYLVNNYMK